MARRLMLGGALAVMAAVLAVRGYEGSMSSASAPALAGEMPVVAPAMAPVAASSALLVGEEHQTSFQWPGAQATFRNDEMRYRAGGANFAYSLRSVTRGGAKVYEAPRKAVRAERDGETMVYRRGAITERYQAVGDELEQLFEIGALPAGEGDLVITGRARTNLKLTSATPAELRFEKNADNLRIHTPVAIDAAGSRVDLSLGYDARRHEMTITVPGAWLLTAAFPIVVDPLVGSSFATDTGIQLADCNALHSLQGGRFLTIGSNWGRFLNSGTGAQDGAQFPIPSAFGKDMAYLASANKYLVAYPTVAGSDEAVGVYLIDAASGTVSGQTTIVSYADGVDTVYWMDSVTVAATSNGWVVGYIMYLDDDTDPNSTMTTVSASAVRVDATGAANSTPLLLRSKTWDSFNTWDDHDWGWFTVDSAAMHDAATNTDRWAMSWGDWGAVNDGDADYYAVFGAVVNATAWALANDFVNEDMTIGWDSDSWAEVGDPVIAADDTNDQFLYVWLRANFDGWYSVKAKRRHADAGGSTAFFIQGGAGSNGPDYSPGHVVYSPIGDVFFVTYTTGGNLYGAYVDGGTNTITANAMAIAATAAAEGSLGLAINKVDSRILIRLGIAGVPSGQMWEVQNIPASAGPTITTTSLPDAIQNQAYSQQLQYTSGTAGGTWSVAGGSLPAGMTLSSSGLLSGTCATTGTSSFTVQVSAGGIDTELLTMNILPPPPPPATITTTSLPNTLVGQVYNQTLQHTGGAGSPVWSIVAGELPMGLTLDMNSGVINGASTTAGSYTFTVELADGTTDEKEYTIDVLTPASVAITDTSLPGGNVGVAYSHQMSYTGGYQDGTWAIMGGLLPGGLTLSPSGLISGVPTAAGTSSVNIQVADGYGVDSKILDITINAAPPAPVITTTTLANGTVGTFLSRPLAYTGGAGSPAWSVISGTLPAGLSLNPSTGEISGTPATAGTSSFTVQLTAGGFDTQALSLTIDPVGGGGTTTSGGGKKKKRDGCGSSAGAGMNGLWMIPGLLMAMAMLRRRK